MESPEQISTNKSQAKVDMPMSGKNLEAVQDDIRYRLKEMKVLLSEIRDIKNAAIRKNRRYIDNQ